MNPLETYLKDIRDIHSTGAAVKETSFYPALSNLLNEIGKTLKPKVRCVINLADRGAGLPDGGLFTPDQFQKGADAQPKRGQPPARGALEVKSPSADVRKIACSEQVQRYCAEYGLVLVTNYRDFLLLGRDTQGKPIPLEAYTLADNEKALWAAALHPQKTAKEHGEQFCEYLKRVMLYNAPLSAPQDVAWFLASYARDAKARVENHKDLSALAAVRDALEQALGMKFTDERGEHFFRSTLVQTIFYGVFSAWVLWHRERSARTDAFNWHETGWSLRVPFIRALYDEIATPTKLGDLGLVEVLDWTAAALNRVDRGVFFQKFQDEHAVQYFYEPFLEAFDPELRKELGVWFTPPEIVKYQVARVNTVLREELNLADGLADPKVVVLDPCCGTGAYLVEVLRHIADTLKAKGGDALLASDLKKAAMTRIFGFEILPAPFVVSHLQLGLMLHRLGAPLSTKMDERVGVYLTNSLTGWEPPKEPKQHVMEFMKELEEERDAADRVKREAKILVVLGNPPYNAFAGVSPEEEQGLVEPYKEGLNTPTAQGGWGIKKFNLDDLYVRFFRLAERRIAEMTGKGVVSFISNFSYLGDPSFVAMRQRFLAEFDGLWFDCMNGDSRETGKLTPEGDPDPSVFSTDYNREGIRVGTAVCVIVRKEKREKKPVIRFRHFWGVNKRQDLLESLDAKKFNAAYTKAKPDKESRYSFQPSQVETHYMKWPRVVDLCALPPSNGLMEKRGGSLIDIDREELAKRMKKYFDKKYDWQEYCLIANALTIDQARFDPKMAREKALSLEAFQQGRIVRYTLRPFEIRWCYYTSIRPIWNEPRPSLWAQCWAGNEFLMIRPAGVASPEGVPFCFTRLLGDNDALRGHAYYFPLQIRNGERLDKKGQRTLFKLLREEPEDSPVANLSQSAREYLSLLKIKDPDLNADIARLIWMHSLAVGYSPAYLSENADGIRRDWPRIPLPDKRKVLEKSAELGRQVAALLDTEAEVSGVTAGKIDRMFRTIGVLTKIGGGALDPDADDLAVTASWGHLGKGGVTMPAKGRIITRPYDKAEKDAIDETAKARGFSVDQTLSLLGQTTCDVYLNDKAYWKNIPLNVWEYYIGGYQVIKKWLSYREEELLGRSLKPEEAREVTNIARRLAAIILLQPALDENYQNIKASTYDWQAKKEVLSESK
jgi:type I restriction-modification system DNA methylase subunit